MSRLGNAVDHFDELSDLGRWCFADRINLSHITCRIQHTTAVVLSVSSQSIERDLADFARRRVHNSFERYVVFRIVQQVQVTQHILDFFTLIEFVPVDDLIGDSGGPQRVLDRSRKTIGSIQDCVVVGATRALLPRQRDRIRHVLGFVFGRWVGHQTGWLAFIVFRKQLLLFATHVVGDQLIGDGQDRFRAAVVLF